MQIRHFENDKRQYLRIYTFYIFMGEIIILIKKTVNSKNTYKNLDWQMNPF